MKKLQILMLAIFASLFACKKETKNVEPTEKSKFSKNLTPFVAQPLYADMSLLDKQPGETFDTYSAYWHDCLIKVKGPLSWDMYKYPTLVNGVPIVASNLTTYDGTSFINYVNSGTDGNVFEVSQIYLGGVPTTGFTTDYDGYVQAWTDWWAGGEVGTEPVVSITLKTGYTGEGHVTTYTGKLIRVTTGSHLAIAPVDYPLPVHTIPTGTPILSDALITDNVDPTLNYVLRGSNGSITSAVAQNRTGIHVTVTGSYVNTSPGTGIFHMWGTIVKANGSLQKFDFSQDTN